MESISFDVQVDPDQFLKMNDENRKLLIDSLSEQEKFSNLRMFKTLPGNKVGWSDETIKT